MSGLRPNTIFATVDSAVIEINDILTYLRRHIKMIKNPGIVLILSKGVNKVDNVVMDIKQQILDFRHNTQCLEAEITTLKTMCISNNKLISKLTKDNLALYKLKEGRKNTLDSWTSEATQLNETYKQHIKNLQEKIERIDAKQDIISEDKSTMTESDVQPIIGKYLHSKFIVRHSDLKYYRVTLHIDTSPHL